MHTASVHLVKTRARERCNTYAVRLMGLRKYVRRLHCVPGTSLCSKIEAELAGMCDVTGSKSSSSFRLLAYHLLILSSDPTLDIV